MYARDFALIATPIGMVRIAGTESLVETISIEAIDAAPTRGSAAATMMAADQLTAWFEGARQHFDLPLARSATPRGDALRAAMVAIPYGETLSYGALARLAGSSARAIGQACARNPFPIVVPCHRVLNIGGRLGAYSAGEGPATKSWLLDHERRHAGTILL